MIDLNQKEYIVIVQCHIVKERCSGYNCERAFNERTGGFAAYPKDKAYRMLNLTCGGCCGRAVHRKLSLLAQRLSKQESIEKDQIAVQLSSCITKDNFHGPPCPHIEYLKTLVAKLELDLREDTVISKHAESRRQDGQYSC